jgi:hypothetical protein
LTVVLAAILKLELKVIVITPESTEPEPPTVVVSPASMIPSLLSSW